MPLQRRRILYVLHSLGGGGSEMLTYRLITGLPREEFEFAVVSLVSEGGLGALIRAEGVPLFTLDHQGGLNLGLSLNLVALIRRLGPHLINTHHIGPLLHTWLANQVLFRRYVILHTLHVLPAIHAAHGSLSPKAVFLYNFLLRRANHVICVSHSEREELLRVPGLHPSCVTAIPNGVDTLFFRPLPPSSDLRRVLGLPPDALIVTHVGAFRPQKNQRGLLTAFRQVVAQRRDVVLLLAGGQVAETSEWHDAQALATALGVADRVRFLGQRSDVREILTLTDVYVQPSLYEGLPLSVMEAMAMERAVVATDVGGNNELIKDGVNGVLVPPGDSSAMASAILRLLEDPPLRARLGVAARQFISKDYSESRMIEQYAAIYESLCRS